MLEMNLTYVRHAPEFDNMHCISNITVLKKYIEDIQNFDVEYGIYFISKTCFFLLFSWVQPCLTSEHVQRQNH